MKSEEITVKSEEHGEFKYILEQPESVAESLTLYGETESLEWLLAGRKAKINAAEWQKVRGTKTKEVMVGERKIRVPKELAQIVRDALAKQAAAA